MKKHKCSLHRTIVFCSLVAISTASVMLLMTPDKLFSQNSMSEQEKIQKLISAVEKSGYAFIRNGSEYSSAEAASHMRLKLSRAGNRIKTADQFIDYLAAKSSMTGQPYMLRLPDGKKIPLAGWLRKKLLEMK